MLQKTATATICQLIKGYRLMSRFEVVESYGTDAPKVGTRGQWRELKADYPETDFSLNSGMYIDYHTGHSIDNK